MFINHFKYNEQGEKIEARQKDKTVSEGEDNEENEEQMEEEDVGAMQFLVDMIADY